MARSLNTERLRLTRLVHVARRELAIEEDAWRALLRDRFKVESSKDLSIGSLDALLKHLKACGFKVQPKAQQKHLEAPHNDLAVSKRDIEAKIACQLKALDKPWPYAHGVARRIYPEVSAFEFLTVQQLGDVSSALERTIRYRSRSA